MQPAGLELEALLQEGAGLAAELAVNQLARTIEVLVQELETVAGVSEPELELEAGAPAAAGRRKQAAEPELALEAGARDEQAGA